MADPRTNRVLSRFFDIRNIIGALLGIYGVLLIIAGLAPGILPHHDGAVATGNTADLYVGTDANWWVGLVLVVVAVGFCSWALLRPVPSDTPSAQPNDTPGDTPGDKPSDEPNDET